MSETAENCTHNCGTCSANCGSRTSEPQSFLEKLNPASSVKKVIGVVSGKGGVGKSLVTSLMACRMRATGAKVGILDADIEKNRCQVPDGAWNWRRVPEKRWIRVTVQ